LETLDALLPANAGERKTLADVIFAKLDSKEHTSIDRDMPDPAAGLNPQVVEAYSKFVCFLSRIYHNLHAFFLDLVYYYAPTSLDLYPSFSK
jgi:hypothetical protein